MVVVVNEERERIKGLCVERERERERDCEGGLRDREVCVFQISMSHKLVRTTLTPVSNVNAKFLSHIKGSILLEKQSEINFTNNSFTAAAAPFLRCRLQCDQMAIFFLNIWPFIAT